MGGNGREGGGGGAGRKGDLGGVTCCARIGVVGTRLSAVNLRSFHVQGKAVAH